MLEEKIFKIIAEELKIKINQVAAVAELLAGEATVPFIARYRKEMTGNLDETVIITIRDRLDQLRELDKRREAVIKSLISQEKLTPELEKEIGSAETLSKLEDIYLPYRPKKRTKGTIAKEKGLEPLAQKIFGQEPFDIYKEANNYLNEEKGVKSAEEALEGARDIIAEWINENAEAREKIRQFFMEKSILSSKEARTKKEGADKYRDYFEWSEPINKAPSHRILAILRGTEEEHLTFHVLPERQDATGLLERQFIKGKDSASEQVRIAINDSYERLLGPSMENETRALYKKKADEEAIRVFAENVRELLMTSPLGQKNILAIDPGQRTGCKVVCLSRQGSLVYNTAIYPLPPQNQIEESGKTLKALCDKYSIEAVAIGNGTGGREALAFCKNLGLKNVIITMVNESGASVYSASDIARQEFPDYDVTVRGAVSIGRRLMDPLAELVKIDPKSIGVGQYQHDVDQKELKKSLDDVVASCVNAVGVEVNTASGRLLGYVSGLTKKSAEGIVNYRENNGPFKSRNDFKAVPGMGPKTFEQAAGFLRIRGGDNPLDGSAVHPESYTVVQKMAADLSCSVSDLMTDEDLRKKITLKNYLTETIGMPTLYDIMQELAKPGRDPRREFEAYSYTEGINDISDLAPGMRLPGVVTNVTAFGAFVDIGVHQDGLVHISQLSDTYVNDPHKAVKVNQRVNVTVLEIDPARKRISLSMKQNPEIGKKTDGENKPVKKTPNKNMEGKPSGKVRAGLPRPDKAEKNPRQGYSPFAELGKTLKK